MKVALRSLGAGLLWLATFFVIETIDSLLLLLRSTKRVKADEETQRLLTQGVLEYVGGIAGGYVVLGLLAAPLVWAALRLWFPVEPDRKSWWKAFFVGGFLISIYATIYWVSLFPTLNDWFPGRPWLVDHLPPPRFELLGALGVVGALGLCAARWHQQRAPWKDFSLRALALGGLCLGAALLLRHPEAPPAGDNRGPNLVILGVDSLRPDHLGHFGYGRETAPHIDQLLSDSVVFHSAWTPLARTYPAWNSILSGTLPITHGIRDNLPEPERLVPRHALLPQVLGEQGYESAFVTDDSRFSYMVPEIGFPRLVQPEVGLQNFAVSVNEPRYRVFHALLHNPIGFGLVPVAAYNQAFGKSYRPQLFTQRTLQELSELSRAERFFMAVHSCVLHAPGDRNWPWYSMFGQAGYARGNRFRYSQSGTDVLEGSVQEGLERDSSLAEQDVRIYDSGIDMADEMVGGVMSELERSGLLDNTIVVLLSDHGEEMWEPDLPYRWFGPNHGFHGYGDGHNRVLLSIRFPDGAYKGQRVDAPVRLIDLAPTLAELMGLEWPNATDGRSMVPLMKGEQDPEPRPVYIETGLSEPRYWVADHIRYPFKKISERYTVSKETGQVHIRPEFQPHLVAAKDRVMQVGDWKLIWFATTGDGQVGLYHRPTDVMNRHDLSAQYPNKTAELGLMMEPYLLRDGVQKPIFAQWRAQLSRPDRAPDPPPPAGP